jgi:hypothetical protein
MCLGKRPSQQVEAGPGEVVDLAHLVQVVRTSDTAGGGTEWSVSMDVPKMKKWSR